MQKPFEGPTKVYSCHLCDKQYKKPAKLQEHLRSHTDERPFQCPHCPNSYRRNDHLKRHLITHDPGRMKSHECFHCAMRFSSRQHLQRHEKHQHELKQYQCDVDGCNERFKKRSLLERHRNVVHLGYKFPHLCPFQGTTCPRKSFATPSALLAHLMAVHPEYRPPIDFGCSAEDTNDDTDFVPEIVQAIVETSAIGDPNFVIIGNSVMMDGRVDGNENSDISGIFGSNQQLQKGQRTKPRNLHQCPHCPKQYQRITTLNTHIKVKHLNYKPFQCDNCGMLFGLKVCLKRHQENQVCTNPKLKSAREENCGNDLIANLTGFHSKDELKTGNGLGTINEIIKCPIEGCSHRFTRDYDLWRHLKSKRFHGPVDDLYYNQEFLDGEDESESVKLNDEFRVAGTLSRA